MNDQPSIGRLRPPEAPPRGDRPLESARFEVRGVLGEGGMGTVLRADDLLLGRQVAVKVLRPHLADDPAARARFQREARGLLALRHPHIVPALDAGADDRGRPFLAMDLLEGVVPLDVAWADWDLATFVAAFSQALDGVAYLHDRGWVHRDLKPQNLLVGVRDGLPKVWLVDFGLAFAEAGEVNGTPEYLAPERLQPGARPSPPEDVYALGIVAWQFLTGAVPFRGEHAVAVALMHATDPLPPFIPRPGLNPPPDLIAALKVALAKAPEQRFPGARALAHAANRALETQATTPVPDTATARIADAVERVARRDSTAPPLPVAPAIWRTLQQHCGDGGLAGQVLEHLAATGALVYRDGQLERPDPAGTPEAWPRTAGDLACARLRRAVAVMPEPARLFAWATLLALLGTDATDAVVRAAEARVARRAPGEGLGGLASGFQAAAQPSGGEAVLAQEAGSGAAHLGAEPLGAEPLGAEPLGAEPLGAEPLGAEPLGTEPLGTEPLGTEPRGADRTQAQTVAVRRAVGAGPDASEGQAPWQQLAALGLAQRHLGRLRLVDPTLAEALVRRSRTEADGRALAAVAAEALASAQPPVEPERVAALYLQAEAFGPAAEALARAARAGLVRGQRAPALDLFEEAARQAGRAPDPEAPHNRARLRLEGALAARSLGLTERAVRVAQQVWSQAHEAQDLIAQAAAARLLAEVDRDLGRYAEARRGFVRVAELHRAAGDARGLAEARVAEGRLAWALGDPAAAADAFDQGWSSAVLADAQPVEAEAAVALAEASLRLGQAARALDGLARAGEALAQQPRLAARGHWLAGEAQLVLGLVPDAATSFVAAELQAARVPDDEAMARALGGRARVAELSGEFEAARLLRDAAVSRALAAGNTRLAARLRAPADRAEPA